MHTRGAYWWVKQNARHLDRLEDPAEALIPIIGTILLLKRRGKRVCEQ